MSPVLETGRYEILENLGCGASCRVDKARDTVIGRTVALKTFLQGLGQNSEQQFLQEAQTFGRLSHTSIAQLYDVGKDGGGTPFLVMEFVSGENLENLLAHSAIPLASAAVWTADLASALACAHRAGIIHGDVKPGNIRVTEDDQVKLVDFGVARFASQVSGSDCILGTPAYLSPEQIEGQKQDGRSDLFSLGIVLYEMITGVRPFAGNSLGEVCAKILAANPIPPSQLHPTLPAAIDRILARCLAKNPDNRYQSGNDLARALYLLARCGDKLTRQPNRPYWFMRPAHPRDLLAIASAVLLVASAVTAADSLRDWVRTRSTPAVAAVPRGSTQDLRLSVDIPARTIPQPAVPIESSQPKSVPKTSPDKRNSVTPGPPAPEVSSKAFFAGPSPLP
jgi:eukaryotic-like serine/threonine-protein kinase